MWQMKGNSIACASSPRNTMQRKKRRGEGEWEKTRLEIKGLPTPFFSVFLFILKRPSSIDDGSAWAPAVSCRGHRQCWSADCRTSILIEMKYSLVKPFVLRCFSFNRSFVRQWQTWWMKTIKGISHHCKSCRLATISLLSPCELSISG